MNEARVGQLDTGLHHVDRGQHLRAGVAHWTGCDDVLEAEYDFTLGNPHAVGGE
jgi:hypothetical protein